MSKQAEVPNIGYFIMTHYLQLHFPLRQILDHDAIFNLRFSMNWIAWKEKIQLLLQPRKLPYKLQCTLIHP